MPVKHEGIIKRVDYYHVDPRIIKVVEGWNPRDDFGGPEAEELKESIRECGVKTPLVLKKVDGDLFLVAGERRLRSCLELISEGCEITAVPAIIERKNISEVEAMYLAVIENAGKPLNPVEEATAYKRLVDWGEPVKKIAKTFGKSEQHIRNQLMLVDAAEDVKAAIVKKELPVTVARQIVTESNGSIEKQKRAIVDRPVKVNRMMNRRAIEKLLAERKGVYAYTSVEAEYRNQGAIEALETVLNNQVLD